MVTVTRIPYQGWQNCYLLSDGKIEAIATTDIGPRIIRCGLVNGPNLFAELPDQIGQTGGESWRNYGGHRLWYSPESRARTYYPDNFPVQVEVLSDGLVLHQQVEPHTGIEKSIQMNLDTTTHSFTVAHCLTNRGSWPVLLAPWAISVMRAGGVAIIPQYRESDIEGLLPNRVLSLWPYTDMNDSRVTWGSDYTLLRQDVTKNKPFKLGLSIPQGWLAYLNDGFLFIKAHYFDKQGAYPDGGVNVELYTNALFLELESLGTLQTLNPGETAVYTESWSIYKNINAINNEADVAKQIGTCLKDILVEHN